MRLLHHAQRSLAGFVLVMFLAFIGVGHVSALPTMQHGSMPSQPEVTQVCNTQCNTVASVLPIDRKADNDETEPENETDNTSPHYVRNFSLDSLTGPYVDPDKCYRQLRPPDIVTENSALRF